MHQKIKTYRSEKYLKFIREQPCVVSGSVPSIPHHTSKSGVSIKGSDYETVPLKPELHMELHAIGQQTFQSKYNVDFRACIGRLLCAYIDKMEGGRR